MSTFASRSLATLSQRLRAVPKALEAASLCAPREDACQSRVYVCSPRSLVLRLSRSLDISSAHDPSNPAVLDPGCIDECASGVLAISPCYLATLCFLAPSASSSNPDFVGSRPATTGAPHYVDAIVKEGLPLGAVSIVLLTRSPCAPPSSVVNDTDHWRTKHNHDLRLAVPQLGAHAGVERHEEAWLNLTVASIDRLRERCVLSPLCAVFAVCHAPLCAAAADAGSVPRGIPMATVALVSFSSTTKCSSTILRAARESHKSPTSAPRALPPLALRAPRFKRVKTAAIVAMKLADGRARVNPACRSKRLSELLPCIGPLDPNIMPDRRLMGVKLNKDGGRAETLLHFSRTTPLAAANKLSSVGGAAGPSLRALGYLPEH